MRAPPPSRPSLHPDLDAARGVALAIALSIPFWALLLWGLA